MRRLALVQPSLIILLLLTTPFARAQGVGSYAPGLVRTDTAIVPGLDHIPIAVDDLEAAAARYRALGFRLKPGRPHANGIRNVHAKFPDGTELELITADEGRDALTERYLRHLADGDGPAFLALYAPRIDRLVSALDRLGQTYRRSGRTLSFPEADPLQYIFFGSRNASPTDLPEHFDHPNGADALMAVWLAGEDLSAERSLLAAVGAAFEEAIVHVPEAVTAATARMPEGTVVLLPGSHQIVRGRRIIGATVRTRSLDELAKALETAGLDLPPVIDTKSGRAVILPPDVTHGIWLEFLEDGLTEPYRPATRP